MIRWGGEIKYLYPGGPRIQCRILPVEVDMSLRRSIPHIAKLLEPGSVVLWNQTGATSFKDRVLEAVPKYGVDVGRLVVTDVEVRSANGVGTHGDVNVVKWQSRDLVEDKPVVVLEDINDRGRTLEFLKQKLIEDGASRIQVVVLFDKNRIDRDKHFRPDHVVMHVDDFYAGGEGLDFGNGMGRDLRGLWELLDTLN